MKKILIGIFILPLAAFGQNSPAVQNALPGSVTIPSLMNLNISQLGNPTLNITNIQEVAYGKQFNNWLKVKVKSNRPWVISVMTGSKYFTKPSHATAGLVPTDIISMKVDGSSQYVTLDTRPKPLVRNTNNAIENNYLVHLKVGPTLGFSGGQYHTNFIFTITPQ